MKDNDGGYALGWVLVMGMVLLILMLSALAAASAFYRHSVRSWNQKQSDLTASSVLELVTDDLSAEGSDGAVTDLVMEYLGKYIAVKDAEEDGESAENNKNEDDKNAAADWPETVVLPVMTVELEEAMGNCEVEFVYVPAAAVLHITVTASKGDCRKSIGAKMTVTRESGVPAFELLGYGREEAGEVHYDHE